MAKIILTNVGSKEETIYEVHEDALVMPSVESDAIACIKLRDTEETTVEVRTYAPSILRPSASGGNAWLVINV